MKNFRTHIINYLTILVLILVFQACKVSKPTTPDNFSSEETLPMIAFFTYSLIYDSIQQEYKMSLISKHIVNGKIKESITDFKENNKKDFRYSLLNEKSQVIFQEYLQCPLDKTIEYVDESGRLQKKEIRLDSTEMFLRISLPPDAHCLSFDMQEKQLLLINLKK